MISESHNEDCSQMSIYVRTPQSRSVCQAWIRCYYILPSQSSSQRDSSGFSKSTTIRHVETRLKVRRASFKSNESVSTSWINPHCRSRGRRKHRRNLSTGKRGPNRTLGFETPSDHSRRSRVVPRGPLMSDISLVSCNRWRTLILCWHANLLLEPTYPSVITAAVVIISREIKCLHSRKEPCRYN